MLGGKEICWYFAIVDILELIKVVGVLVLIVIFVAIEAYEEWPSKGANKRYNAQH